MLRIRILVNAELIAEKDGVERQMQFGAGTYFEANNVDTYVNESDEVLADITLLDGFQLIGVVWNQNVFENHGVPEKRIVKDKPDPWDTAIKKALKESHEETKSEEEGLVE
jgi:hypothetical protein